MKMTSETDGGAMSIARNDKSFLGERYHKHLPLQNIPHHKNIDIVPTVSPSYDTDSFYNMETFPRGKLVIVNMKHFADQSGMRDYERVGTEKDAEALTALFTELGFVVELFEDLTKIELTRIMKCISEERYNDFSTLFVVFLTHGREKEIYATDGRVKIRTITSLFTGANLAGKPKVFLIQACQGSNYMESIDTIDSPSPSKKDYKEKFSLPIEADFLYAYSTAVGFYSWRNDLTGSWFIQTLCDVFRKHAHNTDIVRMLTKVNRITSQRISKSTQCESHGKRQVTSTVSQLRKELYFSPPEWPTKESSMI